MLSADFQPEANAAPVHVSPGPAPDGLTRAHRVAQVRLDEEDLLWLSRGFRAYLASNGTLPLERCLHLPSGDGALCRARRDGWLRQAWACLDDEATPWQRSERLADAVNRFRSALWPRWRARDTAPSSATPLETALYEAFRSHERVPATAMQLHNIAIQHRPSKS